jgi:hypothetical protein
MTASMASTGKSGLALQPGAQEILVGAGIGFGVVGPEIRRGSDQREVEAVMAGRAGLGDADEQLLARLDVLVEDTLVERAGWDQGTIDAGGCEDKRHYETRVAVLGFFLRWRSPSA